MSSIRTTSSRATLAVALAASSAAPAWGANTAYTRAERFAAEARLSLHAGDGAAAGRSYEAAFAALPNPAWLLEAGAAYVRAEDWASAARVYREAVELGLAGSPGQRARQGLDEVLARLQASRGRVAIAVFPATAKVTVDGVPVQVGTGGGVTWVEPGSHKVRAEAEGFEPAERAIEVPVGQSLDVKLSLAPVAGAALLVISANVPGATVSVGGKAVGVTPLEAIPLDEGTVEVRIEKPGYEPWARSITATPGEPTRLDVTLATAVAATASAATTTPTPTATVESTSSGGDAMVTWGWVAASVGLGAVGGGVAMHMLSIDSKNKANALSNTPAEGSGIDPTQYYNEYYVPEYNRLVDDSSSKQTIAFILDGAGGALVVTGVVLLVLGYTDSGPSTASTEEPSKVRLTGFGMAPVPGGSVLSSGFSF